jgi:hypothetical protein
LLSKSKQAKLDEEANLVSFAARSLEFAVPNPGLIRRITHASVELALNITATKKDDYFHLRAVRALLHSNPENLQTVAKHLRSELSPEKSESVHRREVKLALITCTSLIQHAGFDTSYMDAKSVAFWRRFEDENFDIFSSELKSLAKQRAWAAATAATAGIMPMREVIATYGPEVLYQWRMGPVTLRAPIILRLDRDGQSAIPRVDCALDACLAELSELLPSWKGPWFTTLYDYQAISYLRYAGPWRRPLPQINDAQRDAIALVLIAWYELMDIDFAQAQTNVDDGPSNSLATLARRWARARTDASVRQSGLRSIRACQLKPETIAVLTSWIEGKTSFVSDAVRMRTVTVELS